MCGQTQDDCATFDSWPSWDIGAFQSMYVEGSDIPYPTYYGQFYDPMPTQYDCSTGNYKTTETRSGIEEHSQMANNGLIGKGDASGLSYKLYPNPVKDEVNIILEKPLSEYKDLKFRIVRCYG